MAVLASNGGKPMVDQSYLHRKSGASGRDPRAQSAPGKPASSIREPGRLATGKSMRGRSDRSSSRSRPQRREDSGRSSAPASPQVRRGSKAEAPKEIEIPGAITVRDLAELMGCSPIDLIKELMNAGVMANINQQLDHDTAVIVAEEMGYTVVEPKAPEPVVSAEEPEVGLPPVHRREYTEEEQQQLRERPPVVTILGHVDHGKTSLLDKIRETNVQAGEAGGITQHIGAYQVLVNDRAITFLDTPGHEAFTAMRARGASLTDIAVLVVAADDGVQPQTREAISHARAARVPIIVAINKMDLATANPDRVKQQLSDLGLVPEDWGGDTICVPVSARTEQGIGDLLDMILLVAEMANIQALTRPPAEGAVVEGRLDRSRGPTATLLVQEGTLRDGDTLLVGTTYGRIRAMFDYQGNPIKRARPSTPVVVMGLRNVPEAGDTFVVVESEREARSIAEQRELEAQEQTTRPAQALTLEEVYAQVQAGAVHSLNLILKADVQGSLEPIRNSLEQLEVGDIRVHFVHEGVGNIGESDVMLAVASQAVVIGFNVSVDTAAQRLADAEGIDVRTYSIIYRVIEDVERALTGMLEPVYKEVVQGHAIVRQTFHIRRVGTIAGCQVSDGKVLRSAKVRVIRGQQVVHEGPLSSLKRFTEDVTEVNAGYECGLGVEDFEDLQEDDVLEFYTMERER
ncbi:MAG: translation initiation factor IF-2 [Anaerolineae bacterium]|nr:translation initiation factor IF-2 [Anaerolineae bacterium]